jgi:murein DD-endopeptidase MepM/ murein hydrolase activator NlpD
LATSHAHVPPAQPHHHRLRDRARRATIVAGLVAAALLTAPSAAAAPGDDGTVAGAQSAHDAAAAEVAEIAASVTAAEETLQRMTIEAEAASGDALAAQAALATAQTAAQAAAEELAAARGAVDQTQDEVSTIGREAYMGGDDTFGDVALLLDADSPAELLQQAATLEVLGDERTEQLEALEDVEAREARADSDAQAAVADRDRLFVAAGEAEAAANAQLAAAQSTFDAISAEKASLDAQLKEAEIRLLTVRGASNPARTYEAQQAAEPTNELSATEGGIAPTSGRVTSCYGSRWGTLHAGIDIAAPIGTPIQAPEDGVVLTAGPASGFGLALAVQHGDGSITLYGHVDQMFVAAGDAVTAGQRIAEVGNRGQSTGPHLHFEVHTGGLYVNRGNPVPWLTERGISLGGGC